MTCKAHRVNDQMQCSCGLQWDVDEDDPHRVAIPWNQSRNWYPNLLLEMSADEQYRQNVQNRFIKPVNRETGFKAINKMKEMLSDQSN